MRAYVIMGLFIILQSKAITKPDIATRKIEVAGFCLVRVFL